MKYLKELNVLILLYKDFAKKFNIIFKNESYIIKYISKSL